MHRPTRSATRLSRSNHAAGSATLALLLSVAGACLMAVVVVIAMSPPWLFALLVMAALFVILCGAITQALSFLSRVLFRW